MRCLRARETIAESIRRNPPMSMKKTDLVKNLAKKLDGRMKAAGVPGRFAQGASDAVDKREQRRRDAAAGLVPFACKLPADLVKRLNERAQAHEGGANAIVALALEKALSAKGAAA
jgi:hypothetical protein